jgi:hypothetical protein
VNLHAIEQTRSRGQRRVDGVGRMKFDSTQAGQPKVSADWISRAVENREYASSGDYMYALAKVHQSRRNLKK